MVSFSPLSRDWSGRTVYLLGGGPSLRGFEFARLEGRGIVVAINDAMLHAPAADVVFTIDAVWLRNRLLEFLAHPGERVACVPPTYEAVSDRVRYLRRAPVGGLSREADLIHTGENSGFAALGMALMRGASRVALLGYDLTQPGHWHDGYSWGSRYGVACYPRWARMFSTLAPIARERGVDVVNCNPRSGIRCFRFGDWREVAEQ